MLATEAVLSSRKPVWGYELTVCCLRTLLKPKASDETATVADVAGAEAGGPDAGRVTLSLSCFELCTELLTAHRSLLTGHKDLAAWAQKLADWAQNVCQCFSDARACV